MDRKRKQLPGRELIGFILLGVLLVAGLAVSNLLRGQHEALSGQMEDAAWYALSADWDRAKQTTADAQARWQENWNLWAAFQDHSPMGEVDRGFSQLAVYVGDPVQYAAACRELAQELQTLADTHRLSWWNLL